MASLLFRTNFQAGLPADMTVPNYYKSVDQGPRLSQNVEYRSDGSGTLQYYQRQHVRQLASAYTVSCDKAINSAGKVTLPIGTWTAAGSQVKNHNQHDGCWIIDIRVGGDIGNAGKMVALLWGTIGDWPTFGELDFYERFVSTPSTNVGFNMHYGPKGASTQDQTTANLTTGGITGGPTAWHTVKVVLAGNSLKVWVDGVLTYNNNAASRAGVKVIPPTTGSNKLYLKLQTARSGVKPGATDTWADWTNIEIFDADPGATYRMAAPGGATGDVTAPTPNPIVIGTPTVVGTTATIPWGPATDAGSGMKEYRVLRSTTSATGGFSQIATIPATNVTGTRQTVLGWFDDSHNSNVLEEGATPGGLGVGPVALRVYRNWPTKATPLNNRASGLFHPGSAEETAHQSGRMVAISLSQYDNTPHDGYTAKQIAAAKTTAGQQGGTHIYDELVSMFTRMYNQPFTTGGAAPYIIMDYEHEMNADGNTTPADFIAAWKMLWNTSRTVAASLGKDPTLIRFAIIPTHAMWSTGTPATWWPGDQYIDICGTDLYNDSGIYGSNGVGGTRIVNWGQFKQFQTKYEQGGSNSLPTWAKAHGNKPVGVFETGSVNAEGPWDPADHVTVPNADPNITKKWWTAFGTYVATRPEIGYIYVFDQGQLWDTSNANHPTSHLGVVAFATAIGANSKTYNAVVGTGGTITYIDQGLLPSTNYWYRIIAVDNALNTTNPQASGTLVSTGTNGNPKPNAPTNLSIAWDSANGGVLLGWLASTTVNIDTYHVYRDGTSLGSVFNATQFLDLTAAPDTDYLYTVTSYDDVNDVESDQPLPVPIHTPRINQPPGAPPIVTPTALSTTQVQLNWVPATDPDSLLDHYTVYLALTAQPVQFYANVPSSQTSIIVTGLTANTAYDFAVTASDDAGAEGQAALCSVTTLTTGVLPTPSMLLSTTTPNVGDTFFVDIGGTTGSPTAVSVDWGDGSTAYTNSSLPTTPLSHSYLVAGTYVITGSFTNVAGGPVTITQQMTVGEVVHPTVSFVRVPAKFNIRSQFRNYWNTLGDQLKSAINDIYDRLDAVKTEPHSIIADEDTVGFGIKTDSDQYDRLQITGAGDVFSSDGTFDPLAGSAGSSNAVIDKVFGGSTNSGAGSSGSTAPAFTWPDGVVAGTQVLVSITYKSSAPTVTLPSGSWTQLLTVANGNGNDTLRVYSYMATGTETGSVAWAITSASVMWELDYVGFSNVASVETPQSAPNSSSAGTAHATPSLTTTNTDTMHVGVVGARSANPGSFGLDLSDAANAAGVSIAANGQTSSTTVNNVGGIIFYWKVSAADTYAGYSAKTGAGAFTEGAHLSLVPTTVSAAAAIYPVQLLKQDGNAQAHLDMTDPNRNGFDVVGPATGTKSLSRWFKFDGTKIGEVLSSGGLAFTDNVMTRYTSTAGGDGPDYNKLDIYGFRWMGTQAEFAYAGPPGNMLSWDNAVHEVFHGTRALTAGTFAVTAGTGAVSTLELDQHTSPTGFRGAIRATNTAVAATDLAVMTATGTAGVPVIATNQYSFLGNVRAVTVGSARQAQAQISWYTSAGAFISSNTQTATAMSGTSAVFVVTATAPGTAAFAAVGFIFKTQNTEVTEVCGAALFKGSISVYAPPFVAYPNGTYGQAKIGDRWARLDVPGTYLCTTGGVPSAQVWALQSAGGYTLPVSVPLGPILHSTISTDGSNTAGTTELVSTTAFDVTFTAILGRKYRITAKFPVDGSVANDTFSCRLRYDTVTPTSSSSSAGTASVFIPGNSTNRLHVINIGYLDSGTISGTYHVSPSLQRTNGTGVVKITGSTAYAYDIYIEDIGGI